MLNKRPLRIIALTEAGRATAQRVQRLCGIGDLWYQPKPFTDKVRAAFGAGDALLFICATGIVVRTLGPVLGSKHNDPPVLVMDEAGQFVIPLLSGHEGGANDLANTVASRTSAQLVLTTAVSYISPVYAVGMGCERGCSVGHLRSLLEQALAQSGLWSGELSSISSIDVKADEVGLISLADSLKLPFRTFDKEQLAQVEPLLTTRSDYVFNTVGVYGVAESAALVAATAITGQNSELVLPKIKTGRATCATARSYIGDNCSE